MWASRQLLQLLAALIVLSYVYIFWMLAFSKEKPIENDFADTRRQITRLERLLRYGEHDIDKIKGELSALQAIHKRLASDTNAKHDNGEESRRDGDAREAISAWPEPIPVLVFACHRAAAVANHVKKLLKYRTSAERFPIIVSQDCDDEHVAGVVRSFMPSVQYIKHLSGDKANITVEAGHERYLTYYMIARHYKLGLSYVFDKLGYTSVIITEDDLDIAPDFFEYFSATRHLLEMDRTLYCVSAWNDNGKINLIDMNSTDLLYRSDFFPGLGWMMTRELWKEFGPIWPNGFWDDWIRDPLRRKNRSCIRPEISRTGMTPEGRKGASNGLFFVKHLAKIAINTRPVNFTTLKMDYLLKKNYDKNFIERVYSATLLSLSNLTRQISRRDDTFKECRIQYSQLGEYLEIAGRLQIMGDFKISPSWRGSEQP
uniref:Alpha-1,3-mannosyl-glycoprotein 2-beta-N-acetylglucosaminyltransferase n=1 Tax=Parascaris univalens TaxID=6257 RepID=A0A915C9G8_PARUN